MKTAEIVTNDPIIHAEASKATCGIHGPLNTAEEGAVEAYIGSKCEEGGSTGTGMNESDMLWRIVQIASECRGRLRSDEGVTDPSSPESAIIKLLLSGEPQTMTSSVGSVGASGEPVPTDGK